MDDSGESSCFQRPSWSAAHPEATSTIHDQFRHDAVALRPPNAMVGAASAISSSRSSRSFPPMGYRANDSPQQLYATIPEPTARHMAFAAHERERKRRLTDSTPSGREGAGPSANLRSPTSVSISAADLPRGSRPKMPLTAQGQCPPHRSHSPSDVQPQTPPRSNIHSRNDPTGGQQRTEPAELTVWPAPDSRRISHVAEIILPRWQPDSEASNCPVCSTQFSFFHRKHHCRRCGRVVCANCSPHRVTIPYQFIIQPPPVVDLIDEDLQGSPQQQRQQSHPTRNGGEQVRVCNPCVPDPNWAPPPPQLSQPCEGPAAHRHPRNAHLWRGTHLGNSDGFKPPSQRPSPYVTAPLRGSWTTDRTGVNDTTPVPHPSGPFDPAWATDGGSAFERALGASQSAMDTMSSRDIFASSLNRPLPVVPTPRQSHSTLANLSAPNHLAAPRTSSRPHRFRHSIAAVSPSYPASTLLPSHVVDAPIPGLQSHGRHRESRSRTSVGSADPRVPDASLHRQMARPQVAEEDECPVCGNELPVRGLEGSEAERERHIEQCIASHFAPGSVDISAHSQVRAGPPSSTSSLQVSSGSLPQLPRGAYASSQVPAQSAAAETTPTGAGSAEPPRRRATGNRMLVYTATEKDCVGDDGEAAECIICFEDFEPGSELGRLECWCKFHRFCIRQWWDTKGVGSCPTHQLHD